MDYNKRMDRIENKITAAGGVKLVWVEPDENGNFPPDPPGSQTITIKWIQTTTRTRTKPSRPPPNKRQRSAGNPPAPRGLLQITDICPKFVKLSAGPDQKFNLNF